MFFVVVFFWLLFGGCLVCLCCGWRGCVSCVWAVVGTGVEWGLAAGGLAASGPWPSCSGAAASVFVGGVGRYGGGPRLRRRLVPCSSVGARQTLCLSWCGSWRWLESLARAVLGQPATDDGVGRRLFYDTSNRFLLVLGYFTDAFACFLVVSSSLWIVGFVAVCGNALDACANSPPVRPTVCLRVSFCVVGLCRAPSW